jgi:hypothetical protein
MNPQFATPVKLLPDPGKEIEEIECVGQALAVLQAWPVGRRGPVYRCALNSCFAASAGQIPAEDARKSLMSFARITGILVADTPPRPAPRLDRFTGPLIK